ncbi:MAG: tape measure protein, partial [Ignisphaera sp.]|nr:tape measure protein [Ignisphaera sp.]
MAVTIEDQVIIDLTVSLDNLNSTLSQARNAVDKSTKAMQDDFAEVEKSVRHATEAVGALAIAVIGEYAISTAKALASVADGWNLVEGRLRLVTDSTEELKTQQEELYQIAQRTRVGMEATVDLYARIARNTQRLKLDNKTLLDVTETINKTLVISGASAQSAEAALVQFGQGLASGTLRGQELNSVMEQTPRLSQAIADGMGLSIGQLRAQAAEGKITGEAIIKALKDQLEIVNTEFAQMPVTMAQAWVLTTNEFQKFVGELDDAVGITEYMVELQQTLAGATREEQQERIAYIRQYMHMFSRIMDGAIEVYYYLKGMGQLLYYSVRYGLEGVLNAAQSIGETVSAIVQVMWYRVTKMIASMKVELAELAQAGQKALGLTVSASDSSDLQHYIAQREAATKKIAELNKTISAPIKAPKFEGTDALEETQRLIAAAKARTARTDEERYAA